MDFFTGKGGKFFAFATKMAQLMWLNVLTILCSLPVITAGCAMTAMHSVLVQIYRDEEDKITAGFFSAFRKNFWQATGIWLLYLLAFGILLLDRWAMGSLENPALRYLEILVPTLAFLLLLSLNWMFVMQSRYALSLKDTIVYSFTRIIAFPIRTLGMGIASLLPAILAIYFPQFLMVSLLFALSGPGILQVCFYNGALKVMEDPGENEQAKSS